MSNLGWSYPAGCAGPPDEEGDDEHCAHCGTELAEEDPGVPNPLGSWGKAPLLDSIWQDGFCSCRCFLAYGEDRSSALPMPVVRGLARLELDYSVAGFCQHIGCGETLRENLRAIEKHNLEHVWVVLADGRTVYYHDYEMLDTITGSEHLARVQALWDALDACSAACHEAYEEYAYERDAERLSDAVTDLRHERGCAVRIEDDLVTVTVPPGVPLDVTEDLEYAGWVPVIGPRRNTGTGVEVGFRPE